MRHACGYKLANEDHDTRSLQQYLGHRNIQHTVAKRSSPRTDSKTSERTRRTRYAGTHPTRFVRRTPVGLFDNSLGSANNAARHELVAGRHNFNSAVRRSDQNDDPIAVEKTIDTTLRDLRREVLWIFDRRSSFAPITAWARMHGSDPGAVPAGAWASGTGWHYSRPISLELEAKFSAWANEFERAPAPWDGEADARAYDWAAFNRRGIALARRLKWT